MILTNEQLKQLLAELKGRLKSLYGPRFKGLYLYGSYARREPEPYSDIDMLIVLDEFISRYGEEIDRTSEIISKSSLDYGVCVSRFFVTERDWEKGDSIFLENVREDASISIQQAREFPEAARPYLAAK